DVRATPGALTFTGLLSGRAGGDLYFARIGQAIAGLGTALAASDAAVKHVLVDAEAVGHIDCTAGDELLRFVAVLQGENVTVAFARVRDQVRDALRKGGVEAAVGPASF